MKRAACFANSKKGVSLVYVILSSCVLMIFCSVLFVSAMHNLSLTETNTGGRQAYISAKSAIEYAKQVVYQNGSSVGNFYVSYDDSTQTYAEHFLGSSAMPALDGSTVVAQCVNSDGKGNIKITAQADSTNAKASKTLSFSFGVSVGQDFINRFMSVGPRYGNHDILNGSAVNGYQLTASTQESKYPCVFTQQILNQGTVGLTAPEIYFMNILTCQNSGHSSGSAQLSLSSNFVCFNSDIVYDSAGIANNQQYIRFIPYKYNTSNGGVYGSLVYFNNSSVTTASGNITLNGYYFFKMRNQTDAFELFGNALSLSTMANNSSSLTGFYSVNSQLVSVYHALSFSDLSAMLGENLGFTFHEGDLSFLQDNKDNVLSGEEVGQQGWVNKGQFTGKDDDESGKYVFMYTTTSSANNGIMNNSGALTFKAKTIQWQNLCDNSSPIGILGTFTLQADTIWLNAESSDVQLSESTSTAELYLQQNDRNHSIGSFYLRAADSVSATVNLILPHGLKVVRADGSSYTVDPTALPGYDIDNPDTYTYTVPSGTNLFTADLSSLTPSSSGGGSSTGTETVKVTGGEYSLS